MQGFDLGGSKKRNRWIKGMKRGQCEVTVQDSGGL